MPNATIALFSRGDRMRSLLTALAVFVIFSILCWAQQPESAPTQAPPAKTTTKEKKPSPPPKVPEGKPQETPTSSEESKPETGRETPADKDKDKEKDERYDVTEVPPIVTHHQITVDGKALRYTATAGRLPIKRDDGKIEAEMFFVAYTLDGQDAARRPVTFAFNGGPGSASIWLHMGALGPKRVVLQPNGFMPAAPYHIADNQNTLLDRCDVVMVDAIGTGFSRAANAELTKKYLGVKGGYRSFRGIHPAVHHALRSLVVTAVSVGRELRHHPRRRHRRSPCGPRHLVQRHHAAFHGPELPDFGMDQDE